MDTAGAALAALLKGYDLGGISACGALGSRWKRIVGETVAAHTAPEGIRGGTLWVITDSPAWSQELQFQRQRLLARVRDAGFAVETIRFRTGRLPQGGDDGAQGAAAPTRRRPLRPDEAAQIEAWCQELEDTPLRAALSRLIELSLRTDRSG